MIISSKAFNIGLSSRGGGRFARRHVGEGPQEFVVLVYTTLA